MVAQNFDLSGEVASLAANKDVAIPVEEVQTYRSGCRRQYPDGSVQTN